MFLILVLVYLSFIGLGLPDTLLGASWPSIRETLKLPVSYAGILSIIVSLGTIFSSLISPYALKKLGTAKVTILSIFFTTLATLGYGLSGNFLSLCFLSIPLGIGAGSVDVALNNYAALHFHAKHMNWLHAFWGVGATISPLYLSLAYTLSFTWRHAYGGVSFSLFLILLLLVFTLSAWPKETYGEGNHSKNLNGNTKIHKGQIFLGMVVFFFYSAVEMTAGLWCGSYFSLVYHFSQEKTAVLVSMLFLSVTLGRILNGFLSIKFSNRSLIIAGLGIIFLGITLLILPLPHSLNLLGIFCLGLGCSPIYPSLIHETPKRFGKEASSKAIGFQMAASYAGTISMPPLFGLIASNFSLKMFPYFLLIAAIILTLGFILLESLKFTDKDTL